MTTLVHCKYDLRMAITCVKYCTIESQFNCTRDVHQMWQEIQTLTDYKLQSHLQKPLCDELSVFYAHVELTNKVTLTQAPRTLHEASFTVSVVDMKKTFN